MKEINDKEYSKLVNTYKEVTKSDDDYEIKSTVTSSRESIV